jgi:cell division GTPase FtsZ
MTACHTDNIHLFKRMGGLIVGGADDSSDKLKFCWRHNKFNPFTKGRLIMAKKRNDEFGDFDNFLDVPGEDPAREVQDDFSDPKPAFRCAVIGAGQGGGNIAAQFYQVGYRRVLAVNTATADLDAIKEPIVKLALDQHGAGKDREFARNLVLTKASRIRSAMGAAFGDHYEKIIVCMALGGGTGSGGGPEIVRIAQELIQQRGGNPNRDVLVIAVLPESAIDGPRQCFNAMKAYGQIEQLNVPRLYVDNSQLRKMIKTTFGNHWTPLNHRIVNTFHKFNAFATRESDHTVCDSRDLDDVISRGRFIFSAFRIDNLDHKHTIGGIMGDRLENSLFARVKLSTAKAAACMMILNRSAVVGKRSVDDIAPAFTELNNLMMPNSTLHQGIYMIDLQTAPDGKLPPDLFCYVMLGGLDHPYDSLTPIFGKAKSYSPEYGTLSAFLTPE